MHEAIINLHIHTPYSDGTYTYQQIAQAAAKTGVDAVIVTDHNVWIEGAQRYYSADQKQILIMVGEEIHDQARHPQKTHLLVFGAERELATNATDAQQLIDAVRQAGGLSFIAHPVDPAAPAVGEPDISWEDWHVHGFTGMELWNGFSEYKTLLKSYAHAFFYAYYPSLIAHGPLPATLARWDQLTSSGKKIVAVGGSDAHALHVRLGPLRKVLFPYEYHFRCVNTHVLLTNPLTGLATSDCKLILDSLANGRAFIGYDLPASTRGFQFSAQGLERSVTMGETMPIGTGVTLKIRLPLPTETRLMRNGKVMKTWLNRTSCTSITTQAGVYRVESYIHYRGKRRGWIFSNPIYLV